ncbi:MAG: spore coat protein U domain-containing protein [Bdellovibrionaceae bacterium]|nr:spore coat protein U domain-containing protein [Pseudobdellovibrionaceae bacterium]
MRVIIWTVFLGLILKVGSAQACQGMTLHLSQPAPYFSSEGTNSGTFSVVVAGNTTAGACDYFLAFDYGSGSSFSTRALRLSGESWPYQLYKDAGSLYVLKRAADASSCSEVLCGNLASGSHYISQSLPYSMVIDYSNLWRRAGRYTETVRVTLYQGTVGSASEVASVYKTISFDSQKKYDLSLVPTGGGFDLNARDHVMNFPGMSTGMSRSADLILKYNSGAKIFAESTNGGRLRHVSQPDLISYEMRVNGVLVPITYWSQILSKNGTSPASGDVNPVVVTIGDITGKKKGQYKDTIRLTIQSNE